MLFTLLTFFAASYGPDFALDTDQLSGYNYPFSSRNKLYLPRGYRDLRRRGIFQPIRTIRPRSILLTLLRYEYDIFGHFSTIPLRLPCRLCIEIQDQALKFLYLNSVLRSAYYHLTYFRIQWASQISFLNAADLLPPILFLAGFYMPTILANQGCLI